MSDVEIKSTQDVALLVERYWDLQLSPLELAVMKSKDQTLIKQEIEALKTRLNNLNPKWRKQYRIW